MKNRNLSSLINSILLLLFLCSLVETFTYSGFIAKHFSIGIGFGFLIAFVGAFIVFRKLYKSLLLKKILIVLTYFVTFAYIIFDTLDKLNYPNYVFSHFHLLPYVLLLAAIIMSILFLFNSKKSESNRYIYVLLVILPVQYLITDFTNVSKSNIRFMLENPRATYDQKMENAVEKKPYDYALFIEANTPEGSTILIPPQGYPWPQTGNAAYLRYFIYPRNLVSGGEYNSKVDLKSIDYVLVDYGETTISEHGYTNIWPKFDVKGEYILYWNPETGETKKDTSGMYKYNANDKSEKWGIIKIKH